MIWRMPSASSIKIVLKVQYAVVSATDHAIYLAFSFRLACLASPPHLSLGMFSESGPVWISVSRKHCVVIRPSRSKHHLCACLVLHSWETLGVAAGPEGECAGKEGPGGNDFRSSSSETNRQSQSHRKLHDYLAINEHVKYGNMYNNMYRLYKYAQISFICKHVNYMQFVYMQKYAEICQNMHKICRYMQKMDFEHVYIGVYTACGMRRFFI